MSAMGAWSWLGVLAGIALGGGIVVLIAGALSFAASDRDDALAVLRARFARGEIDDDAFARSRAALGGDHPRGQAPRLLLVAIVLLIAAILAAWLAMSSALGQGGSMVGMMGMMGPGPTAPAGTSVTMAGPRFSPSTIAIKAGQTVRWFNDDAMPHTVTASNRAWDSGNLLPGSSFARRFDSPGSYPYICRYHPWMQGLVVVSPP